RAVRLVELPHPEQVRPREAAQSGEATCKRGGELVDDTVTPFGARDLPADVLAELPVEHDQLRVHRLVRAAPGRFDERDDFSEANVGRDHDRGRSSALWANDGRLVRADLRPRRLERG